jgi:hypothetical protein
MAARNHSDAITSSPASCATTNTSATVAKKNSATDPNANDPQPSCLSVWGRKPLSGARNGTTMATVGSPKPRLCKRRGRGSAEIRAMARRATQGTCKGTLFRRAAASPSLLPCLLSITLMRRTSV